MKKTILLFLFMNFFVAVFYATENKVQQSLSIKMPEQTEILSFDKGTVLNIGYDLDSGNFIKVEYDNLKMIVTYCNLKTFKVRRGESFYKNQILGFSGFTGAVAEPCLNVKISITPDNQKEIDLADYSPHADGMVTVYSVEDVKFIKITIFYTMYQTQFCFCLNKNEITGFNKRIEYQEPYETSNSTEKIISVFFYDKTTIQNNTDDEKLINLGLQILEDEK